jgi:hypothetical protein
VSRAIKSWNDFIERDDVAPKHKAKISIPVASYRVLRNFAPGLAARSTALALLKRILIKILIHPALQAAGNSNLKDQIGFPHGRAAYAFPQTI